MPWNEGKGVIREYLKELNKEKKVVSLDNGDYPPFGKRKC